MTSTSAGVPATRDVDPATASTRVVDPGGTTGGEVLGAVPGPRTAVDPPPPADLGGRPLRVLVVGINFGPEHTGIAPYTTQLCGHLAEQGADVQVFTGVPHYPSWTVARGFRWRLRRVERRAGLEVRRLRHHVPATQSAVRRGVYELTFALQVLLQRPTARPDVVLAVVPSLLSAVVSRLTTARSGVPLVVWAQDLMGRAAGQSGIAGGDRVQGVVGAVEAWLLRRAERVLVLNAHFRDHVESVGVDPLRVAVCPNWTHVSGPSGAAVAATRARFGWGDDEVVVLHTGNMGLKQGLENVVDAARLAGAPAAGPVRFVLMGDGSQRAALQQKAEGVDAVSILPPVPTELYADVLAAADILLVNERAAAVDMSLPSKLTSYLRSGRPVIAASSPGGGTAAEVARSGGGVVVAPDDPEALLAAVVALAGDPWTADELGRAGRRYAVENLDPARSLTAILRELRHVAVRARAV